MKENIPIELYRISEDIGESTNLAEKMPEKLAGMKAAYQEWFADVSSTRPDNYAPPRIIVGSDKEKVTDLSIQDWRFEDSEGWGTGGKWHLTSIGEGPCFAIVKWDYPIGDDPSCGRKGVSLQSQGQQH